MKRTFLYSLVCLLLLSFAISCSSDDGSVITPPAPVDRDVVADAQNNGTLCIGLWQVTADKATGNVDLVQLRTADKIVNVLGFMEPPALTSMNLDWPDLNIDFPNNHMDVGIILKHPFPGLDEFSGFDVRGVCFGPVVENADGLTIIPSPEYFSGMPFGYQDGMLGAPDSFGNYEGLAGYKYFCEGIGEDDVLSDFFSNTTNLDDRGKFTSSAEIQRNYSLDWNDTGYAILVFNYAIYANFDWPTGDTPWTVDDWELTANSAEAFCLSVTELSNSLFFASGSGGGDISLMVEVWDWQGDITDVTIESLETGIISQVSYDAAYTNSYGTFTTYIYDFYAVPGAPATTGDLDILITATDDKTFGEVWFMDMLPATHSEFGERVYNCFIYTTNVIECAPPVPTGMTPSDLLTYPGVYDDVAITGDYFTLAGGVTDVYLDDGTTEVYATDINVTDDQNLTCDFDLTTFSGDGGDYDLVVVTACEGRAVDMANILDNLLFYADFADDDGGMSQLNMGGGGPWSYLSSDGVWDENGNSGTCSDSICRTLATPEIDIPSGTYDLHFELTHSGETECWYDAYNTAGGRIGYTVDGGSNIDFHNVPCTGSTNWLSFVSGTNFNSPCPYFTVYFNGWEPPGLHPNCNMVTTEWQNRLFGGTTWGSMGSPVTSHWTCNDLIDEDNVQFCFNFASDVPMFGPEGGTGWQLHILTIYMVP